MGDDLPLIHVRHGQAEISSLDLEFSLALNVELYRRNARQLRLSQLVFIVGGKSSHQFDVAA